MDVMLLPLSMHADAPRQRGAVSANHADPHVMLAVGLSDNSVDVHSLPGHATGHQDSAAVCLGQQHLHGIVQDILSTR